MRILFLFILLLTCITLSAQSDSYIQALIIDKTTSDPVSYAHVYNHTNKQGTISNDEGYFRLKIGGLSDSILISFIGYKEMKLNLKARTRLYTIELEPSSFEMEEVTIIPEDDGYLFELIKEVRKKKNKELVSSKAYYSLKTYQDTTQIELVEGYYNVFGKAYDLNSLHLKQGRLALRPHADRVFTSLESSKAFNLLDLMQSNDFLPEHPFNIKKSQLKKSFFLSLKSKYVDAKNDSIYFVEFEAKPSKSDLFSGAVWINKSKLLVEKIQYYCNACPKHPFEPIFSTDNILNVDLKITRTFKVEDDQPSFKHIDFDYSVVYESRPERKEKYTYDINSKAVLYAYDHEGLFHLPKFKFNLMSTGDFRKINAMPYNDFFWENNDEYAMTDAKRRNERFFNSEYSITNKDIFKNNDVTRKGMFQHPYIIWDTDRVFFTEYIDTTSIDLGANVLRSDKYKFSVKLFLDRNNYRDKEDLLTATIFDPYESFYHDQINDQVHCFINIYFDICEIHRRKLHKTITETWPDDKTLDSLYDGIVNEMNEMLKTYLKEANGGRSKIHMPEWNNYVLEELGIDNIALFNPFPEEEGSDN